MHESETRELGFYPSLYKLHAVRLTNVLDPIIDLAQDASFDTCANQRANDLADIILMAQIQQFVCPHAVRNRAATAS